MKMTGNIAAAVVVIVMATAFLYFAMDSLLLTPSPFGH